MKRVESVLTREMLCQRLQARRLLLAMELDYGASSTMSVAQGNTILRLVDKHRKLLVIVISEVMPLVLLKAIRLISKRSRL